MFLSSQKGGFHPTRKRVGFHFTRQALFSSYNINYLKETISNSILNKRSKTIWIIVFENYFKKLI